MNMFVTIMLGIGAGLGITLILWAWKWWDPGKGSAADHNGTGDDGAGGNSAATSEPQLAHMVLYGRLRAVSWPHMAGAVVVLAAVWFITSWPVAAIAAGVLTWFAPQLFGGTKAFNAEMDRIDAVASWTESLRDTISSAAGLEQAICVTAEHAPQALQADIGQLTTDIRTGTGLEESLRRFATRVNNDIADLVVLALIAASKNSGNVAMVLGQLATTARSEAAMRMRIHASQARIRSASSLIALTTVVMVAVLMVISADYMAPYGSVTGQLVLIAVAALFGMGLLWLAKLSGMDQPKSFLREES